MAHEHLQDSFSSDESFEDEDATEESSDSDIDAKLAEDEVFDAEFLRCYSALKKKDQKIYDKNVKFFDDEGASSSDETTRKDDETNITSNLARSGAPKMTLLDINLRSSEEATNDITIDNPKIDLQQDVPRSYYEKELAAIKKSIEEVNDAVDESDDDFLIVKDGTALEKGPNSKIASLLDKIVEEDADDLDHLKQVWINPKNLSKEDKYLRDYILNKRYLPANDDADKNDETGGFFSKNLEDLSDVESETASTSDATKPSTRHSDEQNFDKITRIPRNSTKTIRDMVEKREKREKRAKKLEKEKKIKKNIADADYEDMIDGMPTRFHYRETEANDFGLTAEELLMATDEELDQWVSLKECVAYKSRDEEIAQKRKFEALRDNMELKKKIFKSIYGGEGQLDADEVQKTHSGKKRSRKRKRDSTEEAPCANTNQVETEVSETEQKKDKKKKIRRRGLNHKKFAKVGVAPDRLLAYGLSKTKLKKRKLL